MSRLYLSNPCAFLTTIAHGAAGAVGARLSLRPPFKEGQRDCIARANRVARTRALVPSCHRPRHVSAKASPGFEPRPAEALAKAASGRSSYSRDIRDENDRPWCTGSPACAADDKCGVRGDAAPSLIAPAASADGGGGRRRAGRPRASGARNRAGPTATCRRRRRNPGLRDRRPASGKWLR
jgi:hypothetical protein